MQCKMGVSGVATQVWLYLEAAASSAVFTSCLCSDCPSSSKVNHYLIICAHRSECHLELYCAVTCVHFTFTTSPKTATTPNTGCSHFHRSCTVILNSHCWCQSQCDGFESEILDPPGRGTVYTIKAFNTSC